jgi:hypothetical protein
MLFINYLLILIANFNYLIINLNVVRHNLGENVTPTSKYFIYRMMNSTHPHQLRPDLHDRNPQGRPYALARVEGYNGRVISSSQRPLPDNTQDDERHAL